MPHYYFHVRRGQITVLDHDGIALADTTHAKVEAAQRAHQVVNGEAMNGASMKEASARRGGIIWGINRRPQTQVRPPHLPGQGNVCTLGPRSGCFSGRGRSLLEIDHVERDDERARRIAGSNPARPRNA